MRPFYVRRTIWVLFGAAICLAMLVPSLDFIQQWQAPVVANIAFDPADPAVGAPVRLVITLQSRFHDQAREAHLVVTADMREMPMEMPALSIPADHTGKQFSAPLSFNMSGLWGVTLHLAMPAHATWDHHLLVQVRGGKLSIICGTGS